MKNGVVCIAQCDVSSCPYKYRGEDTDEVAKVDLKYTTVCEAEYGG